MLDTKQALLRKLRSIDGKGYAAYKELAGSYDFGPFQLTFEHIQADPYAPPSRVRLTIGRNLAAVPELYLNNAIRTLAVEDFLLRQAVLVIRNLSKHNRWKERAEIRFDQPTQAILKRSAVELKKDASLEVRFTIGLPARGRSIMAKECERMLNDDLTALTDGAFNLRHLDQGQLHDHVLLLEDQFYIREQLAENGLIAFIGNGSLLARESGISDRPLLDGIPFVAPPSLQVEFDLPSGRTIAGLGIPQGVSLIVGGGFHGKSTLLQAIQRGIYNHIRDDGREYCITDPAAVKVRAEEGRRVARVDISPFITHLPHGRSTSAFSTDNASGSTSQAANILEAIEAGATVLLLDEDTSATNFMIRDVRMQALVAKEQEPITPFLDRVRELYDQMGISTLLVVGGVGDYLDAADVVIGMNEYQPADLTAEAKRIAVEYPTQRRNEKQEIMGQLKPRFPMPEGLVPHADRDKMQAKGVGVIRYGEETVRLEAVEQLLDESQTRFIGAAIRYAVSRFIDGSVTVRDVAEQVVRDVERKGFQQVSPYADGCPGDYAMVRPIEIAAAMNRIRSLRIR